MKLAKKKRLLPILLGVTLVGWPGAALSSYLVFSGSTYWSGLPSGQIRTPAGERFASNTEQLKLWRAIIGDSDTVVYDVAAARFEVFEGMSPYDVLSREPEFAEWDVASDAAIYSDDTLAWSCTPTATEIDTLGALIHIGQDNPVLCDSVIGFVPEADSDGDGVPDSTDNCPGVPNPSQADTDNDNIGNACDSDDDNDGVSDFADNCPVTPNPSQQNTDGDAQGNACDLDDDNDGLTDQDEITVYLTNPLLFDTDGDTFSDGEEVAAGTDPLDENSFPVQTPGLNAVGAALLGTALGALAWLAIRRRAFDA